MRDLSNSVSGGGGMISGKGLRDSTKQMSLKARLGKKGQREGERRGRLQIKEISDTGDLTQAANVGAAMREARLLRGVDITSVSTELRIRREHIEAIEDFDIGRLPEKAYTLGFVRSYAGYLALDVDDCVRLFRSEYKGVQTDLSRGHFPEVRPDARLPQGSMLILALVLGFAIYGGWHLSLTADRMVTERVPPVPDRLEEATTNTPLQASAEAEEVADLAVGGPTLDVPVSMSETPVATVAVEDGINPADLGTSGRALEDTLVPPADAASLVTANLDNTPGGRKFGAIFGQSRIVLRASQNAWLRVEDREGQVLIQENLRENDRYFAPDEMGLILSVRDAGAFDVYVDEQMIGKLGRQGQVLPSVSLDPEMIGLLGANRSN